MDPWRATDAGDGAAGPGSPERPALLGADRRHVAPQELPSDSPRSLLLSLRWDAFRPFAVFADGHGGLVEIELAPLRSTELDIQVESGAWCPGRVHERDGRWVHVPCPGRRAVTLYPHCRDCSPLADQSHIFEPGVPDCPCAACAAPHEVYLAFHGERAKVGMTRRSQERLIEQGADGYLVAATLAHRYETRQTEKRISERLGIPQMRRAESLLKGLLHPPGARLLASRAAALADRLRKEFDLQPGPFVLLAEYPLDPLPGPPLLEPAVGRHRGTLLGLKGPLAVLRTTRGPLEAFRLDDAEGHWVRVAGATQLGRRLGEAFR